MLFDRKKIIKFFIAAVSFMIVSFLLINLAGSFFIQEIVAPADKISTNKENQDINNKAPYFEIFDTEWNKLVLTDIIGKPAVILFWNSWNNEAQYEFKVFNSLLDNEGASAARIIAINSQEDRSFVKSFIKRGGYKLGTYLDESGAVGDKFNAQVLPQIFFLNKDGVINERFIGQLGERDVVNKIRSIISQ